MSNGSILGSAIAGLDPRLRRRDWLSLNPIGDAAMGFPGGGPGGGGTPISRLPNTDVKPFHTPDPIGLGMWKDWLRLNPGALPTAPGVIGDTGNFSGRFPTSEWGPGGAPPSGFGPFNDPPTSFSGGATGESLANVLRKLPLLKRLQKGQGFWTLQPGGGFGFTPVPPGGTGIIAGPISPSGTDSLSIGDAQIRPDVSPFGTPSPPANVDPIDFGKGLPFDNPPDGGTTPTGDGGPPDFTSIFGDFLKNFLGAGDASKGGGGDSFNLPIGLLLALTLGGGLSQLLGGGQKTTVRTNLPPSVTDLANLIAGQAPGAGVRAAETFTPSPGELGLPGATGAITGPLGNTLAGMVGAPLDTAGLIRPIEESFSEHVIPELKSLGIRAGAPGGSGEQRLLEEATGRFGEDVAGVLSRAELQRRATAGQLAPLAAQLQLGGPTAEAGLGALIRQLSTQQRLMPLQTMEEALRAIGGAIPGEKVTETTPGVGQVGAGVAGNIAQLLILQSILRSIGKGGGTAGGGGTGGGGTGGGGSSLLGSLLGAGIKEIPDILKVILGGGGDGGDPGSILANLLGGGASAGTAGGAAGIRDLLDSGGGVGASVGTGEGGEILGAGQGFGSLLGSLTGSIPGLATLATGGAALGSVLKSLGGTSFESEWGNTKANWLAGIGGGGGTPQEAMVAESNYALRNFGVEGAFKWLRGLMEDSLAGNVLSKEHPQGASPGVALGAAERLARLTGRQDLFAPINKFYQDNKDTFSFMEVLGPDAAVFAQNRGIGLPPPGLDRATALMRVYLGMPEGETGLDVGGVDPTSLSPWIRRAVEAGGALRPPDVPLEMGRS